MMPLTKQEVLFSSLAGIMLRCASEVTILFCDPVLPTRTIFVGPNACATLLAAENEAPGINR